MTKELTTRQAEELHRIILTDPQLKALEARLFKIYSLATPQTILKKNGEVETLWLDSDNNPQVQLIKDSIDSRKRQLSKAYCGYPEPFTKTYDEVGPPPTGRTDEHRKAYAKMYCQALTGAAKAAEADLSKSKKEKK